MEEAGIFIISHTHNFIIMSYTMYETGIAPMEYLGQDTRKRTKEEQKKVDAEIASLRKAVDAFLI